MTKFFCILLILPFMLINTYGKTNLHRLYKALKEFNYPDYRISDHDINLNFNYATARTDFGTPLGIDHYYDHTIQYSRDIKGQTEYIYRSLHIKSINRTDFNTSLSFFGMTNDHDSITTNDFNGIFDSSSKSDKNAHVKISSSLSRERHWGGGNLKGWPFFSVSINADLCGAYSRNDFYRHTNYYLEKEHERVYTSNGIGKCKPEVGIGKRKPIDPIYRAFEIERKLKKSEVIRDTLTEKTINELSTIIASMDKYHISHEKYEKYFMNDIESILKRDSSIDSLRLHAFSLFKVEEAINSVSPSFDYGLRIAFDIAGKSSYALYKYSYGSKQYKYSAEYESPTFNISWTFPVFSRVFLGIGYRMMGNSTFDSDDDFKFNKQVSSCNIYYFLTDKLLLSGSISNLPMNYLIPNGNKPEQLQLSFLFYIEDNVSLNLQYLRYYDYSDEYYSKSSTNESMQVGVNYDF